MGLAADVSSLPTASQQQQKLIGIKELVDNGLGKVPSIYVRPSHDQPCNTRVSDSLEIPVIDLAGLFGDDRPLVVQQIGRACDDWGFFQVVNHGVQPLVIESLRAAALQFFQQPAEERMRFYSQNFRCSVGYSTSFNPSLEKVREWRDTLSFNRFPGECDGFQEAPAICKKPLLEYIAGVEQLAASLYKAIFESLDLPDQYLEAALPPIGRRLLMGINYYPPCPDPSLTLGLGGHSDVSCLTILQPGEVPGLQVRKGETWVTVKRVPNAFVVNLADQTEILTNGKYKSIEHRVVTNTDKPRMSMACFFGPTEDTIIAPLSKLIDEKNPPRYRPTKFGDYVQNFATNRLLPDRGTLEFARV